VLNDIIISVLYYAKLRAQTEVPGKTQEVEQEEKEVFYLVMGVLSSGLFGIPWHLRLKVKFLCFDDFSLK